MRYLYQDSVELSVQRDFVQDMKNVLEVVRKVCPRESAVISTKKKIEARKNDRDQRISRVQRFETDTRLQLDAIAANDETDDVKICKKSVMDTCTTCVRQQVEKIGHNCDKILNNLSEEIDRDSKQIYEIFEAFLEFGVYNAACKHSLATDEGGALHGEFTSELNDLSVVYELWLREPITIKRLVGSFTVPLWGTSGIIHKEDVVKMRDVSNCRAVSIEYTDQYVNATFEDKKGDERVRIEMKRATNDYAILYGTGDAVDLTKDETIAKQIDGANTIELMNAVIDYVDNAKNRDMSNLKSMTFGGRDVIKDSAAFDALKTVLAEYGNVARECLAHGASKSELVIKYESPDGDRTERYIPISEIDECFSQLGGHGRELADAFGLSAPAE